MSTFLKISTMLSMNSQIVSMRWKKNSTGEVHRNMDIAEELDTLKRSNVVREASTDLSESQKEKLESLSNGVDFKDEEDFQEKVVEIKEAYFRMKVRSM